MLALDWSRFDLASSFAYDSTKINAVDAIRNSKPIIHNRNFNFSALILDYPVGFKVINYENPNSVHPIGFGPR